LKYCISHNDDGIGCKNDIMMAIVSRHLLVIAVTKDDGGVVEVVLECGGGNKGNKSNSTDSKSNNGGMTMVIYIYIYFK
jgi:hypothetical protein